MTDEEKMARIEALVGNARYTANSAGFRTATECAVADAIEQRVRNESLLTYSEPGMTEEQCRSLGLMIPAHSLKPGSRVYVSGNADTNSAWSSQCAGVTSFALRHMRLSLQAYDVRRAIREAGKAHTGAYFGVLRRTISDIVSANNVFAAMQASNLLRALSTKRGMKVARKAKLDIDALLKVADKWNSTRQPTLAIMGTEAYDYVKKALSHGTTITTSSSGAQ